MGVLRQLVSLKSILMQAVLRIISFAGLKAWNHEWMLSAAAAKRAPVLPEIMGLPWCLQWMSTQNACELRAWEN
jgi:F0F1-type ATP synthase assembly protein I